MENSSSTSSWTPECLQLENQEYELAEELKHNTNKDLERDAMVLKQIGVTYQKRGELLKDASCFVKASALYNSALIRSENTETKDDLKCFRANNEQRFLDLVIGIKDGNLSSHFIEQQKNELLSFREDVHRNLTGYWNEWNKTYNIEAEHDARIQKEKEIIDQVKRISSEISEFMISLIRNILHECFHILGTPPQKYAVIGLGSLSRNEMTPYSDLESAILIEDDVQNKQYFRNLANTFHLFMLNFGETPLPALAIKSLNNFDKVGGSWFFDSITSNGFCMDGAMPWACKTPVGRPDRKHKPGVELIQTPKNMSHFQQKDIAQKEGYHLADILYTCTLIDGSEDLLDHYERLLNSENIIKDCQQRASQSLSDDLENYQEKMSFGLNLQDESSLIDVKKEIFRFPSLITNTFRMIHHLKNKTPWLVLGEMEEKHLISVDGSHNIQIAVSIAVLLRLMTCLNNKGQINSLTFLSSFKTNTRTKEKNNQEIFFSSENIQWIMRYYFTVLPLVSYLSTDISESEEKNKYTFYDHNNKTKGKVYSKCAQFENAIISFKEYLRELGYYDSTILYSKQSLETEKKIHGDTAHLDIASSFNNIGSVYCNMGDYNSAILYLQQSLEIQKKVHGDTAHHDRAISLNNIGLVYLEKGDYDSAILYHQQSLEVQKKVHGDTAHPHIAISFNNIGLVYSDKGEYDSAILYHQQSLEIQKKVHGDTAHPDIAKFLSNIGSVYLKKGDYDNAILYYQQSLEMQKKVHGDTTHPDIAVSLSNIGSVYGHKGDYDSAILYHQQSLEMQKKVRGDTPHPGIAKSLNNIGSVYSDKGEYDSAILYCQQSLEMKKKVHGDTAHPDIAKSLNNIGSVYSDKGDYGSAILYFQQSLEMKKKVHGDTAHPDIAKSLSNIGSVYSHMADYDSAILYYQQSLEMQKKVHGDTAHPVLATLLNNIGSVYCHKADYDSAILYYQQSLEMRKKVHGDTAHPDIATSLNNIADVFTLQRLPDHALFYFILAKKMFSYPLRGSGHPVLFKLFSSIAVIYHSKKSYRNALLYYQQSLVMHKKCHGDSVDPVVPITLGSIGSVYHAMGEYEVALIYHIQAVHMEAIFSKRSK